MLFYDGFHNERDIKYNNVNILLKKQKFRTQFMNFMMLKKLCGM